MKRWSRDKCQEEENGDNEKKGLDGEFEWYRGSEDRIAAQESGAFGEKDDILRSLPKMDSYEKAIKDGPESEAQEEVLILDLDDGMFH